MFDQVKDLDYPPSQQCVFFAVRSMLSLYIAVLACVAVFLAAHSDKAMPTWANWSGMIVLSVFLIGFLVFLDGFDDQVHGYRAGLAYRTCDSINSLIGKTILRMIAFYTLIVAWAFQAIGVWHRNTVSSHNQ
jgi:hypothetical protein